MLGMLCGFATELYLWLGTQVAWTWWVLIGTAITFAVGWLSSLGFTSNSLTASSAEIAEAPRKAP
jgi:uncharacterized SAM-binding protein YcdF (DUF218 family)